MERLSIQGNYFDCQLYGGRLYLWTFQGSLQVFDYPAILDRWNDSIHNNGSCRCRDYESEASLNCISENELRRFLIYERNYLTDEFPAGTEFISGRLFEANVKGLFCCKAPLFDDLKHLEKIWDAPLVSVKGAQRRGLVCSGGRDGVFWRSSTDKDVPMVQVSPLQSVNALFCDPGIYAFSSLGEPFLIKKEDADYHGHLMFERDLFPHDSIPERGARLTWGWKSLFYLAKDHRLQVYEYVADNTPLQLIGEIQFYLWKGDFISGGSYDKGTVVELDKAICLFTGWNDDDEHCTIFGPVTRWRYYPRSQMYKSHVHIIFDDRMDIVALNDIVRMVNPHRHMLERRNIR